jgi:hypothetical protein
LLCRLLHQELVHHMKEEEDDLLPRFAAVEPP